MKKSYWIWISIAIVLANVYLSGFNHVLHSDFKLLSEVLYGENNQEATGKFLTLIFTVVGAACVIVGLYINNKRVQQVFRQNNISEKGNVDTRFNNAVGRLESDNVAIILGAIFTLHQIAKDNKHYVEIVHNILCSYLRLYHVKHNNHTSYKVEHWDQCNEDNIPPVSWLKCSEIIQLIMNCLFISDEKGNLIYEDLETDLTNVTIINCQLQGARINKCDFTHASIWRSVFLMCSFSECDFKNADLRDNCLFVDKNFTDCIFSETSFYQDKINFDNMKDCDFTMASFKNCLLKGNNVENSYFDKCSFEDNKFYQAPTELTTEDILVLNKCTFEETKFIKNNHFENCIFKNTYFNKSINPDSIKFTNSYSKL